MQSFPQGIFKHTLWNLLLFSFLILTTQIRKEGRKQSMYKGDEECFHVSCCFLCVVWHPRLRFAWEKEEIEEEGEQDGGNGVGHWAYLNHLDTFFILISYGVYFY